tara:strand:+ start:193 stop:393 length:201 start_codon:yes stop_codon:yes gene_type:complete
MYIRFIKDMIISGKTWNIAWPLKKTTTNKEISRLVTKINGTSIEAKVSVLFSTQKMDFVPYILSSD